MKRLLMSILIVDTEPALKLGDVIMQVDLSNYRPTKLETLLGDLTLEQKK